MKHIKLTVIIAAIAFLSSCTGWLTIEPEGKVVSTDYWTLESDVEAVVATCYRALIEDPVISRMLVYGELRSDNVNLGYSGGETLKKIMEANILPNNSYANWSDFYKVINYANLVLAKAPEAYENDPNFSLAQFNAKKAEVLAIRALTYFYLVRAFRDVPFITEASLVDTQDFNQPKSTEDEILDHLEADLIQAEAWALTSFNRLDATKGRFTKVAIRALLADIYLWRNKYDQCIAYCDKVIDDPALKLIEADEEPYFKIFGMKNSTESIFELQFSPDNQTWNSTVNSFYGHVDNKEGNLIVPTIFTETDEIFNHKPEITDLRRKDYVTEKSDKNVYNIFKYAGLNRNEDNNKKSTYNYRFTSSSPANWIVYRLTDVMLMKAEALVQKEQFAPAIHIVNTTYMRSNPNLTDTDTLSLEQYGDKKALEELVLLERQRELMFEGKRWFDLLRLARRDGKTQRLVDYVIKKVTENQALIQSKMKVMDAMYFPIHESEIHANPKLKQNPYYESKFK